MAAMKVEVRDGWPVMGPLRRRQARLLRRSLLDGERVLGQLVGSLSQVVVATDSRILIVKTGFAAGQAFGGKVTSYGYRGIGGVEVRTGLLQGEFELLAGGLRNVQGNGVGDKARIAESPNGVLFPRRRARHFATMAGRIREAAESPPPRARARAAKARG